jgi:uncharacterized membrane protein
MSLERGISRIGTVIGSISGICLGVMLYKISNDILLSYDKWKPKDAERFSDLSIFLISLAVSVLGFLITFYAFKITVKVINWIIKGFKE